MKSRLAFPQTAASCPQFGLPAKLFCLQSSIHRWHCRQPSFQRPSAAGASLLSSSLEILPSMGFISPFPASFCGPLCVERKNLEALQ